ncbi:MAG TPA: hypothetical protein DDW93_07935 [Firmicutes bacterium]|jgi:hypothetical protein|nr:hypothetical protein [Bacillota bacterium]HBT15585.1 hypothetical protein [Bacillota bacterium]
MNNQNMNRQNVQNQRNPANQNLSNVQNYNKMANMETGSELTQSTGEISRILATQQLVGLEIGSIGQNANLNYQTPNNYITNPQLEVDQAPGQISQNLSQQSKG